jgi:uncharacterized secreted protein with C-terminal beta-propeller domain
MPVLPRSLPDLAVLLAVALLVGGAVGGGVVALLDAGPAATGPDDTVQPPATDEAALQTFDSEAEFRAYLDRSRVHGDVLDTGADPLFGGVPLPFGQTGGAEVTVDRATADSVQRESAGAASAGSGGDDAATSVTRQSGTNVQEAGIDEPDLLKTTGGTTFYALGDAERHHPVEPRREGAPEDGDERRPPEGPGVALLNTSDPAAPAVASRIPETGQLLLSGDHLLVFAGDEIVAYDVSDREDPERVWRRALDQRVVAARLLDGTVYLVTVAGVDYETPCPVRPFGLDGPAVDCTSVHHPGGPATVDATYTVSALSPETGDVSDTAAFVGSRSNSVVYVSGSGVYVTYTERTPPGETALDFLLSDDAPDLPDRVVRDLERVRGLNASSEAKAVEVRHVLQRYYVSLPEERRVAARANLREAWRDYRESHKRDFVRTGVVRVDVGESADGAGGDALSVGAVGEVPGVPLNQFSLDEHEGHLRVATTVAPWGTESENDLYVLDSDLDVTGSVTGMGVTERVYSVRFVGDRGYVVTFRRIDPFHVLDLSDPANPTLEGELKLPGFSSYLHPLSEDRILGIGEEDGQVKAVVFDVSDPTDPTVADDFLLDDRFSAISQSHHAFLLDRKHEVFFLPGSDGGYVFSYADGLSVETHVDVAGARRAAYLNDYLYVFGRDEVAVVDERTWNRTTTVDLRED